MKTDIMNSVNRTFGKLKFNIKKHSPEMLVISGVIGVVTSAVMACKATTKIDDILNESKNKIDKIHDGMEKGDIKGTEYTQEDGKKDLLVYHARPEKNKSGDPLANPNRHARIQSFEWGADGLPIFGEPVADWSSITSWDIIWKNEVNNRNKGI